MNNGDIIIYKNSECKFIGYDQNKAWSVIKYNHDYISIESRFIIEDEGKSY